MPKPGRAGFSLIELLVVLAVAVLLTSIMLPALARVRENARRLICSSNMYQIGLAMQMYADDTIRGWLPYSAYGVPETAEFLPQEMMAAHRGEGDAAAWEGLGLLYHWKYCQASTCFYCPSHTGKHAHEQYVDMYLQPGSRKIFTNYHYAGHLLWEGPRFRGTLVRMRRLGGERTVLATDGLRTVADFNHGSGMNVLRGDISVRWREDLFRDIYYQLPTSTDLSPSDSESIFGAIWNDLQQDEDADTLPGIATTG